MTSRGEPTFYYRNGLCVLKGSDSAPTWMVRDSRTNAYIAAGSKLPELRTWAEPQGIIERVRPATDSTGGVDEAAPAPFLDPRTPRPYQTEGLDRWLAQGGCGSIVLPTGAGKSLVALLALHRLQRAAVVVVPTKALLSQWFNQIADALGGESVGAWYGNEKDPRRFTVTTYHSAFDLLERYGDRYDLLIFDEVHHLADTSSGAATAWHDAPTIAPATYRLGLTATYPDGRDSQIQALIGPVAYRRTVGEMRDAVLADFATERRFVSLTREEREAYDRAQGLFDSHWEEAGYEGSAKSSQAAWKAFMARSSRDPEARRAHRAFQERERIVQMARGKLLEAAHLLRLFPTEQALLFCGSTESARRVSREFAIPMIDASTGPSERKRVLDGVADGRYRAVACVRVLDEGWDVPSAKLGIVLGDSTKGSPRQHAQRLGRILRRRGDAVASLFEIVAADTHEFFASQKRRGGIKDAHSPQFGLGL